MLEIDSESAYFGVMAVRPEPHGLRSARSKMRLLADDLAMDEEETSLFILAVGEAISNAYSHGTPDRSANLIYLSWSIADATLTINVKDEGMGFYPERHAAKQVSERGHGMMIMESSVDRVEFSFNLGTSVMLTKYLDKQTRPEPSYKEIEPEIV